MKNTLFFYLKKILNNKSGFIEARSGIMYSVMLVPVLTLSNSILTEMKNNMNCVNQAIIQAQSQNSASFIACTQQAKFNIHNSIDNFKYSFEIGMQQTYRKMHYDYIKYQLEKNEII